ncbi:MULTISPECIES: TnsD family Tn7-like transposition protein [Bacillus]|uniref:TnsD family Tn7-like transposition protein n=1 Tax=Bacillus TaxID=1386 RepID=UPI0013D5E9FF|nr:MULTISPECIES: TnsD family Tn7-like transposition protein [Bacillus]MCU5299136.1 TnsD family transposase [Bacillus paranthracis]
MLNYFPAPYEDELFYSIVARYHMWGPDSSKNPTMEKLFNKSRFNFGIESIGALKGLVDNLQVFSEIFTISYFIERHSLIPLIRPFKTKEWYEELSKGSSSKIYHRLFSLKKGNIKSKEHLYYCLACVKEQYQNYGEGYWNRIHQVPGVFVCIKHQAPLMKHPVNIKNFKSHNFIYPSLKDRNSDEIFLESEIVDELIGIAEDVKYLLDKNFASFSQDFYVEKYETLLKVNGIGYPVLKRHQRLSELLQDHYSQKLLRMLESTFQIDDRLSWINYILSHSNIQFCHPIRHILIMRCLCGSVKNFFENEYIYEPFGKGPWICMNPLANHYLKKCVEKVEIGIFGMHPEIQGDFECTCGYIYRLKEWEQNPLEVATFSKRIVQRGHVWEMEFSKLVSNKLTLTEIGIKTGHSPTTIRHILDKRNNLEVERRKHSKKVAREKRAAQYKRIWIKAQKKHPDYTRVGLQKLNKAVYAWLSNYDRAWLEEHLPPKDVGKNSKKRSIDSYHYQDLMFTEEAKRVVNDWAKYEKIRGKLIRKTYPSVTKILGIHKRCLIKERYPVLKEYITTIEESLQDFQKRRIRYVLDTKFKGKVVSVSTLITATSIKKYVRNEEGDIKEYLYKMMESHNQEYL